MNPVLLHREWLIQPEAMHSMAASLQGIAAPFTAQPQADPPHLLLSVEDGIGVVNIEGPILRKPDLFARVFLGATSSEDIGEVACSPEIEPSAMRVSGASRVRLSP